MYFKCIFYYNSQQLKNFWLRPAPFFYTKFISGSDSSASLVWSDSSASPFRSKLMGASLSLLRPRPDLSTIPALSNISSSITLSCSKRFWYAKTGFASSSTLLMALLALKHKTIFHIMKVDNAKKRPENVAARPICVVDQTFIFSNFQ